MSYLIGLQILPSIGTQIIDSLKAINLSLVPYAVNLTVEKKSGLRTMALGREGYVREISKIATANPDDLSRHDNPVDLSSRIIYDELLEAIRQEAIKLVEKITETQLANSNDIMLLVDSFVVSLQNNRSKSSSLDESMKQIDEYNKKFSSKTPPAPEPPAAA